MDGDVDLDAARHQLVQALTRSSDPDVIRHLDALGQELDIEIGTERCPRCDRPVTSERLD